MAAPPPGPRWAPDVRASYGATDPIPPKVEQLQRWLLRIQPHPVWGGKLVIRAVDPRQAPAIRNISVTWVTQRLPHGDVQIRLDQNGLFYVKQHGRSVKREGVAIGFTCEEAVRYVCNEAGLYMPDPPGPLADYESYPRTGPAPDGPHHEFGRRRTVAGAFSLMHRRLARLERCL